MNKYVYQSKMSILFQGTGSCWKSFVLIFVENHSLVLKQRLLVSFLCVNFLLESFGFT